MSHHNEEHRKQHTEQPGSISPLETQDGGENCLFGRSSPCPRPMPDLCTCSLVSISKDVHSIDMNTSAEENKEIQQYNRHKQMAFQFQGVVHS